MKYNENNPIIFSDFSWKTAVQNLERAIELTNSRIAKIKTLPPSFENTIDPLEKSDVEMNEILLMVSNMTSLMKDEAISDEIDEVNKQINQTYSKYCNDVLFDKELFKLVEYVYLNNNKEGEELTAIKNSYKSLAENGVNLEDSKQARLREIDERLGEILVLIDSNIQKESLEWVLDVDSADVDGIPEDCLLEAKNLADERKWEGFSFEVNEANFYKIVEFAKNKILRENITSLYRSIGNNNDDFDNKELIKEVLVLSHEKARILGYSDFSEYVLVDRMAKTTNKVMSFLNELEKRLMEPAKNELDEMIEYAKKDGVYNLNLADEYFYETKIKENKTDLDMKDVRKFLPYEKVIKGLYIFLKKIYGVDVVELDIPTYHKDVKALAIKEKGTTLGIIYLDSFTRKTKDDGAWMNNFMAPSAEQMAIVLLATNFSPKVNGNDTLLDINEVKALFHEMGHCLHSIFSKTKYSSMGGCEVAWDFVELPSQIMENFVLEDFVLDLITSHIDTGLTMPKEMRDKIRKANLINNAMTLLSFTGLAKLDMNLHMQDPQKLSIEEANQAYLSCKLLKPVSSTESRVTNFSHILGGGYSVGYYSYQWAKVLDVNCFNVMKKHGFSKDIMNKFRSEILEKGSSRDENESYQKFSENEPSIDVYLESYGIK